MSEEEGLYVAKELLNLSEDVYISYNKLLNYYLINDEKAYLQEKDRLNSLILREKKYYDKLDENVILFILNEMDDSEMLSSIENSLDKYTNITKLGLKFNEISYFRILCMLRDNYIIKTRLSRFDDTEIMYSEIEEYNNEMLNNIIVENQIFNDFLSLFIFNLDNSIKNTNNFLVKKNLITYKYISSFVYGKNNLGLLDSDANNLIYSRYLYDMLVFADRQLSYNYDIMKTDYLDKVLYNFLKDYSVVGNELEDIINICFIKSVIMLYHEDYDRVSKIYDSEIRVNDSKLDNIIKNRKNIANQTKVLTLNK